MLVISCLLSVNSRIPTTDNRKTPENQGIRIHLRRLRDCLCFAHTSGGCPQTSIKTMRLRRSIFCFPGLHKASICRPGKQKTHENSWVLIAIAETEGFEPSKQFPVYTLSKRAPSATRTSLLN